MGGCSSSLTRSRGPSSPPTLTVKVEQKPAAVPASAHRPPPKSHSPPSRESSGTLLPPVTSEPFSLKKSPAPSPAPSPVEAKPRSPAPVRDATAPTVAASRSSDEAVRASTSSVGSNKAMGSKRNTIEAKFKVGEEVFYQTKNSAPLAAKIESVNYPDADEGNDAEVTYSIDIGGRKRETVQSRLSHKSAVAGPPVPSTEPLLALPPPPAAVQKPLAIEAGPPKQPAALPLVSTSPSSPKPPDPSSSQGRPRMRSRLISQTSSTGSPTKRISARPATDGPFIPSYEWQEVGARSVPPGMDVKTFLDGSSPTIARIPPEWRLQVDVNGDCYHRMDVTRSTTIQDIIRDISQERLKGKKDVTITADGVSVDANSTVEAAGIFGKKVYAIVGKN